VLTAYVYQRARPVLVNMGLGRAWPRGAGPSPCRTYRARRRARLTVCARTVSDALVEDTIRGLAWRVEERDGRRKLTPRVGMGVARCAHGCLKPQEASVHAWASPSVSRHFSQAVCRETPSEVATSVQEAPARRAALTAPSSARSSICRTTRTSPSASRASDGVARWPGLSPRPASNSDHRRYQADSLVHERRASCSLKRPILSGYPDAFAGESRRYAT
jgi:hypothetical protein